MLMLRIYFETAGAGLSAETPTKNDQAAMVLGPQPGKDGAKRLQDFKITAQNNDHILN
jgi:hypothetical protein